MDDGRMVALRGGLGVVPGLKLAGVHAGIKARKRDLALLSFDAPQVCAAVVTTNEIKAAPVLVSNDHLAKHGGEMRALVCNSGCANACTGARGDRDARATARQAATLLGIEPTAVVIASTGVIGVPLPMDRVQKGLERCVAHLEGGGKSASDAAEAIMTTDRVPKLSAYSFRDGEKKYVVGGIAKGAGMIAPNMATMLAFVATDAPMSREVLHAHLLECVDESFNMISVDGDMSTNDAIYAFAPVGKREAPGGFAGALRRVCLELAQAMVADGEGATKTLAMHVSGARDVTQARKIARAIINSNLVKTALYGEDPNWGRVIAAAGSVNAGVDPDRWSLHVNDVLWVDVGAIEVLSEAEAREQMEHAVVALRLDLGIGEAAATAWGCDLSKDYVRINASYRT
ncbi:MAG TPA: bifunctional glutamate N-acetyltransferase/amino-acid acetyltransferase ArgJ [Verrucomicrobiae bacterium]|jgi:glutamate N-acetyltransferase/amino-acid N-acetyltransferase|nr:bifunctional glutamate N-acetyltransferase/amino-acid acetyltransferase ArgJ [Verrucomicrobiae bacterium]